MDRPIWLDDMSRMAEEMDKAMRLPEYAPADEDDPHQLTREEARVMPMVTSGIGGGSGRGVWDGSRYIDVTAYGDS